MKIWSAIAVLAALTATLFAGVAGASLGDAVRFVSPGIVDVNTNLGYQDASAAGTGIVLTSSGEVLTNNHVIRGATTIRVTDVGNGRTYAATVVGYSVSEDIAVLQLKGASHLRTVSIGRSSRVRVGDAVAAVGNAGGVGGTPAATSGRIIGLGRSITASEGDGTSERLTGLIETSAQLEPGDSGGPLVDSAGRVIGIDTAGSGGFRLDYGSGGGFAIPIDQAISLARQIEAGRSSATTHIGPSPLVGVNLQAYDPYYGDSVSGAVVAGVLPSSPADRAGLAIGDVITAVDGHALASPAALTSLLLRKAPGDTVRLTWLDQSGSTYRATVRLATGPPQ